MPSRFRNKGVAAALDRTHKKILTGGSDALKRSGNEAADSLNEHVRDWSTKLNFEARSGGVSQQRILWTVYALGSDKALDIFGYVDKGTEPHVIMPKKPGGRLAFNTGYSARTLPIARSNVGTGTASGPKVVTPMVNHPGSEARDFSGFTALEALESMTQYLMYNLRKL